MGVQLFVVDALFSRAVQLVIPIETFRTCDDFSGVYNPCPPAPSRSSPASSMNALLIYMHVCIQDRIKVLNIL